MPPSATARARRRSPARPPGGRHGRGAALSRSLAYRVTVRHGASVSRDSFDDLDVAVTAAAAAVERVRAEGSLQTVKMLREFEPAERVAARIEVASGGWLRGRAAGVDVMGDGTLVPFAGGVRRRTLQPRPGESAFDAVRRELGAG